MPTVHFSMRLEEEYIQMLDAIAERMRSASGLTVTRADALRLALRHEYERQQQLERDRARKR